MLTIFQFSSKSIFLNMVLIPLSFLLFTACKKEAALDVSGDDKNYFLKIDNPADPVDHALFKFYEQTGIAGFYTDTIYKWNISKPGEVPERYNYKKLGFTYAIQGEAPTGFRYLKDKTPIPALLSFLQDDVIQLLPSTNIIPSLFFIDSFYTFNTPLNKKIEHGWISMYGLNTVGLIVKDVSIMSEAEKNVYAASIAAGIAEKWIQLKYANKLQTDFYKVTRDLTGKILSTGAYLFVAYSLFMAEDKIPTPESLGLLHHPMIFFLNASLAATPTESMDLRAFLTAAFRYSNAEFSTLYDSHPPVIQKFNVVRELLLEAGFNLP